MTVIVIGRVYGLAGQRAELVDLMGRTSAAARGEPGCRAYDFAATLDDPDTFLIVEEWDDQAALATHFAGPAYAVYQQRVFGLLARPSDVAVHDVAATTLPQPSQPMDPREAD
jgi:quinol monooxygenase YgiN